MRLSSRLLAIVLTLCLFAPLADARAVAPSVGVTAGPDFAPATEQAVVRAAQKSGLRPTVIRTALRAYHHAVQAGAVKRSVLTVIDYSLPSHVRRLWVIDLARGRVLARELVAHGRGSGEDMAQQFSNRPGSYESSLGTFVTAETYDGKHGLSLRLDGLNPGLNDHAMERAIVMHGAWYVSEAMVRQQGRLGRSEGCPALNPAVAPRIIDMIRGGSVVFAYYPTPALRRAVGLS
jgi:hypothetical protein